MIATMPNVPARRLTTCYVCHGTTPIADAHVLDERIVCLDCKIESDTAGGDADAAIRRFLQLEKVTR